MSYGANQQLIALKLREGSKLDIQPEDGSKKLVRDNEQRDRDGDRSSKKQNQGQKKKKKDNTKLSIDHRNDKPSEDRPKDESRKSKPVKESPKEESVKETTPPREVVEPKRIGLAEDGEYDPAAALDQALKISEQKRVEDVQTDNERLAEELAREIETPRPQETKAPIEFVPDFVPPVEVQQPVAEQVVVAPQAFEEVTPELPQVQDSEVIGDVRQNGMVTQPIEEDEGPTFGGVLNATAESAAEAKRLAESESRNRTILTRSTPGGEAGEVMDDSISGQGVESEPVMPSFEMTPLPTTQPEEVPVRDVFDNDLYAGQTLVPPTPAGTLEEIDLQHRQPVIPQFDAPSQAAPQAMPMTQPELGFVNQPAPTPPTQTDEEVRDMFDLSSQPMPTPSVPIGQPLGVQTPDTPPPPPMPDFSQLPPLPSQMPDFSQVPMQMPYDAPAQVPDNLGQILPPAPQVQSVQQSSDPGQFQIPGQQ